jgi:uncharacterized membrane protein YdjX (TVP38/TMEM64 family)
MAEQRGRIHWWTWLAGGLGLALAATALAQWGPALYRMMGDPDQVRTRVAALGGWGPAAIIFLEMAQVLLAPIPGQAVGAVSGYLYGPWLGSLYAMAGTVAGSVLLFTLVRRLGRPALCRLLRPDTLSRLDDLARRGGALFLFLIFLVPFTPDDLACAAAALTPMPFSRFLLLVAIGRLPGVFLAVWVGAHASAIHPAMWIVLLAALACAAIVLWHWGKQIQGAALRGIERVASHNQGSGPSVEGR